MPLINLISTNAMCLIIMTQNIRHPSIPAATCPHPPSGNCRRFARLVSPRGGTLAISEHPRGNPKNLLTFLMVFIKILFRSVIENSRAVGRNIKR